MLKAIVFDFDGVISNSEPVHFATFQKVLAQEGIRISKADYFQRYLAMDDKGAFTAAFHDHGRNIEITKLGELIERKSYYFKNHDQIETYADTIDFIHRNAGRYPFAINSGALREEIENVLEKRAIAKHFSVIVSAEDVRRCKPDPEGYLQAVARLNQAHPELRASARECLAIEDSVGGVRSAIAAGMKCVAVTNTYPKIYLEDASHIVTSIEELTEQFLTELFG
ncbi:MAG: HAD family phosphatase [Blastocatellia bacterium]|nr:HAD family phosphatase [Blastocatellia bacterium]